MATLPDVMFEFFTGRNSREHLFTETTPLGASGTFTSDTLDGLTYRRVIGKAFADQSGTLEIQNSDDGNTWDAVATVSVNGTDVSIFDEVIYARYVRFVYTNGATAQGTFRLSAYTSKI